MDPKAECFQNLYESELKHYYVFKSLADREKDPSLKSVLQRLAKEELKHSQIWKEIPYLSKVGKNYENSFFVNSITALSGLVGLQLTIKVMEYGEVSLERKLEHNIKNLKLSKTEGHTLSKIRKSEKEAEDPLKDRLLNYSPVLNNIRSVIFGMNDGLVEILGAVAGFAAAIKGPQIILVAGLIVAIAGTLSMTGGAYLAVEYEKSIYKKKETDSSKAAAFYTGIAYIFGSLFPLLPFLLGFGGYYALALSIIITALVLILVSILISIVSDTSIAKRIRSTLLISLGIVAITIIIGIYARNVLHLSI